MRSTRTSSQRQHGLARPASKPARPTAPQEDPTESPGTEQGEVDKATQQVLYTPEEGAELLRIRASWLRRKAAARAIPCRFIGKHLRFARSDLEAIAGLDTNQQQGSPRS